MTNFSGSGLCADAAARQGVVTSVGEDTSADHFLQLAAAQRSTNFPVVLVGITGGRLEVACAVYIDAVYVSSLYAVDITGGFHFSKTIDAVARVFRALTMCCDDLQIHYAGVAADRDTSLAYMYPSPTSDVSSGDPLPRLTYRRFIDHVGRLTATSPDLSKAATAKYIATLHAPEGTARDVIVKFTARYNADAHRLLAAAGSAPTLHFCGRVVGGLHMVVMDYVRGQSILQRGDACTGIPPAVPAELDAAVSCLHGAGYVFGDLHAGNILYGQAPGVDGDRVFLVDFDWAGKEGEARYPATLNGFRRDWEDSVHPGGPMLKLHDLYLVDHIRSACRRP